MLFNVDTWTTEDGTVLTIGMEWTGEAVDWVMKGGRYGTHTVSISNYEGIDKNGRTLVTWRVREHWNGYIDNHIGHRPQNLKRLHNRWAVA